MPRTIGRQLGPADQKYTKRGMVARPVRRAVAAGIPSAASEGRVAAVGR